MTSSSLLKAKPLAFGQLRVEFTESIADVFIFLRFFKVLFFLGVFLGTVFFFKVLFCPGWLVRP